MQAEDDWAPRLLFKSSGLKHNTEPDVSEVKFWGQAISVCRPAFARVYTTTAENPAIAFRWAGRVRYDECGVQIEPIPAPLVNIAVHVIQPPTVRFLLANGMDLYAIVVL
jgi:hypothetical protein